MSEGLGAVVEQVVLAHKEHQALGHRVNRHADVSIAKLFIAGVIPGLMLAALFSGYIMLWALRHPGQVPAADGRFTLRQKLAASPTAADLHGLIADWRSAQPA
jgi:hypothetical protein